MAAEPGALPSPAFNASASSPVEVATTSGTHAAFSKEWMDDFGRGDLNCTGPAKYPYEWRPVGYGSNMNCEIGGHLLRYPTLSVTATAWDRHRFAAFEHVYVYYLNVVPPLASPFGETLRTDLLLAWTHAILVEGNNDLSVIANTPSLFARTTCEAASNGLETRGGWPCIFAEMPHVCTFDDSQVW